jgi:hypothetical protein
MASIRKPGPYNPQKATAYVGKGVLKNGGDTILLLKELLHLFLMVISSRKMEHH